MSNTVDDKVVEMKFNNAEFERGVRTTLASLANLNKGLQLQGATKGLENVSSAAGKVNLGPLSSALETVKVKFGALQTVAVAALATIASHAVQAGNRMIQSFTVRPLIDGLHEYETTLNSVQTILSNTQWEGAGMKDVNNALLQLNQYSDKTIYNFSQMARNVGTFTAAGVKLDTSVSAIKGIANLAAVSGSNADQASTAMYQLSQALATGTVKLMDWNSVVNAGMGGKVFQDALKETARAHGVGIDKIIKKEGSFRDSLQTGWLSSGILTETLNKFTGDMTNAQLKQLGYTDKQIKSIQKLGKTATDAATKIKTFSQLTSTLKEAAGSGWAQTFQLILGDFEEAKTMFTNVYNVLGGAITASANARNKILGDWKKLGGRTALIDTVSNAFHALISVLKPIKEAFRSIFPAKTGKDLYNITVALRDFTKKLKIGGETADELKRTFAGVFAIFSIAGKVFSGVIDVIQRLFGSVAKNSGGFLQLTAGIGDWLVALNEMLEKSGSIRAFFQSFADVLSIPFQILGAVTDLIGRLFGGFDSKGADNVSNALDRVSQRLSPLQVLGEKISNLFSNIGGIFEGAGKKIGEAMAHIGDAIGKAITPETFSQTLDVVNTALLGGIVLLFKRFFSGGLNFKLDAGGGMFAQIKTAMESVTDTMKAMQTSIKADAMLKIAASLGIMAAAIFLLSTIDSKDLTKALVAMTAMFVGLQIALAKLATSVSIIGAAKLPALAASLVLLSSALLILALAMKVMASLDFAEMLHGLLVMGSTLFVIGKAMKTMPKGMVMQAVALNLLAVALTGIAVALKLFATIDWQDMAHGLAAMVGSLAGIAAAMRLMPKGMVLQAAALLALSIAINAMAAAIKIFATMSWKEISRGLASMTGALAGIAGAMRLMPKGMLLQAAALVAVSVALNAVAGSLKIMASMSWTEIAKGLVTLAGALLILAGGLYLMSGTLAGSAALLVATGALILLTPVLIALGSLEWSTIIKSMTALAGVFIILGLAGYALTPVIATILGLGAAMVLIGTGLALAGVAALAFAAAFGIVVGAAAAGVTVLTNVLKVVIDAIPMTIRAIALGLVEFAKVIIQNAPTFFAAMSALLLQLINAIIKVMPRIGALFMTLINMVIRILRVSIPRLAAAGLAMLLGILTAINKNLFRIVTMVTNIIVTFLRALAVNLPRITDAGVKTIIAFINGLAQAVRDNSEEMGKAGMNLAVAMIEGMAKGFLGMGHVVIDAAKDLAKSLPGWVKKVLGIKSPSKVFEKIGNQVNEGFAKGLKGNKQEVYGAFSDLKSQLSEVMKATQQDIDEAEKRLRKLTNARHKDREAIHEATLALARARREHAASTQAYAVLTKSLVDERNKLGSLANQYDIVTRKLEAASQRLADAKKTRDDYNQSVKDQYSDLPDIDSTTHVKNYVVELQKQIDDTKALASALQTLRARGLNDAMYKELLAKGTEALPFVKELVAGGQDSVNQINSLGSQLAKQAAALGNSASKALYQAGVDSAAGLVAGLKKQQKNIAHQMDAIAWYMVRAIKKALGIKSPSREFAKIGNFAGEGMAEGLRKSSIIINKAAFGIGDQALESMRKSISGMSTIMDKDIDVNPKITPVLDLTNIKKDSAQIGNLLTAKPISVEATHKNARAALVSHNQNKQAAQIDLPPQAQKNLTFNQYNNSPKALSSAEIYRQTKNQISVAKEALKNA